MTQPANTMSLKFLEDLLAQPERSPRTRKVQDIRDYDHWFKLDHKISDTLCANEQCVCEALGHVNVYSKKLVGRHGVTATVNGYEMCRFCFLDGWHHNPTTP